MADRDAKGMFVEGNQVGIGNDNACKYKDEYADLLLNWFKQQIDEGGMPTFEDFAVDVLDVAPNTLDNWAEKYPRFAVAKEKALAKQRAWLCKGGLSEKLNPSFTKFVLSACHGMREKTESDVNMNANAEVGVRIEVVDKVEKKS